MITASPRVAVIIATRDRSEKIGALLTSMQAVDTADFEAVVVDQSTDDRTERAMAVVRDDPRFHYVRTHEAGSSRARNLGASLTTAPHLVIADDDCVVPPDWLHEITRPFDEDRRVGVVFCTVVPVPFDAAGHTPHITFEHERRLADVRDAWRAGRSGLPLGAGMAIRREAFDEAGGFDELLGPGARFGAAEDSDLSWRTMLLGWTTVHRPSPVVVHDGFRDLEAFRVLVRRDLHGVGGTLSKYLRDAPWRVRLGALALLVRWMARFGVAEPARDLLAGRRPSGLRRPLLLLAGALEGVRTPLRAKVMFEPSSAPASASLPTSV